MIAHAGPGFALGACFHLLRPTTRCRARSSSASRPSVYIPPPERARQQRSRSRRSRSSLSPPAWRRPRSRSASRRSSRRAISTSTGAVKAPSASLPCAARVRLLAFAERDAEGEIARLRARAGQNQIAEAGETRHGLGLRAEALAEAEQLGEAARGQRRRGARAEPAAGHDAGRDRQHVLGGAADLDAAHVGRMIGTEASPSRSRAPAPRRACSSAPPASPRSAGRAPRRRRSSGPTGSPAPRSARIRR